MAVYYTLPSIYRQFALSDSNVLICGFRTCAINLIMRCKVLTPLLHSASVGNLSALLGGRIDLRPRPAITGYGSPRVAKIKV